MKQIKLSRKNNNYARNILLKLLFKLIIFSAVYWVLVYVFDYLLNGYLIDLLQNILSTNYGTPSRIFYIIYYNQDIYVVSVYGFGLIVICLLALYRAVRGVAQITSNIDFLLDTKKDLDDFPDDLKNTELALKNVKFTIERNEQLAREAEQRKNDLVVYLAHDLKTPLTSVIGYLTILEETSDLPLAQRVKYTGITLQKAYRLEQLINEFFEITRYNLQSIVLENNRINLSMMLHQIADEFSPILTEKNLVLETEFPPELNIIGDADKLARVFDNVLKNAVNYSYPNTTVYLSAALEEQCATITIRNNGDEIPEEKLERIFDKFFRLDEARGSGNGGSGLGLAIAKHIVELYGGAILAQSCREYTEFCINLPQI